MLGAIGLKIKAVAAATIAALLFWLKLRGDKIETLEHDEKVRDKIENNHEKQLSDKQEALESEKQTIENRIDESVGSRRDRASRL